jgi:hypothetical protein
MLYLYALNWSEIDWKDLEVPVLEPPTLRFNVRCHDHYTMQYCMRSHAKLRMTSFFSVSVCCLTRPFLAWIKKFKKYFFNVILVSMDRSQCPEPYFLFSCLYSCFPQSYLHLKFRLNSLIPQQQCCQIFFSEIHQTFLKWAKKVAKLSS